ncbi:MAG: hypothetical protein MJ105_01060 [Lachnospiraceae bacterium]|nr:hypothetical protein [Lachnospiraceae bacterium]
MKMNHKILICTTFRDFTGGENDRFQKLFLKSIREQSFTDYLLVVTLFGEKNVKKEVADIIGDKVIFIDMPPQKYKFSLTDVVLNGIENVSVTNATILLWCTSDIVFEKNYLQTIVNNYSDSYAGITHPNYYVSDTADLSDAKLGTAIRGIDVLFFSTALLLNKNVISDIKDNKFIGWGVFENFLASIGANYAQKRINTVNVSNVYKCENEKKIDEVTSQNRDYEVNYNLFINYLKKNRFSLRYRLLMFCHFKYKNICKKKYALGLRDREGFSNLISCMVPDFINNKRKIYN